MHQNKKIKLDYSDKPSALFDSWCRSSGIVINNAIISPSAGCSGNGLFATEDFKIGDVIFTIPKSILFTRSSSDISELIEKECRDVENNWIPILIGTIYEYCLKEKSTWFPYFNLTLDFYELDLPIFWSRNELDELLISTGIVPSILNDMIRIEKDFVDIVEPFVNKYSEKFNNVNVDLHFYKKIVSFVMAYSFTLPNDESQFPILVPLADILNHVTDNNSKLVFGDDALSMVAIKNIMKDEEIFNTYGKLSNSSLLHMYGFAENLSNGKYESVELPVSILLDKNVLRTEQTDASNEDDVFIITQKGIVDRNYVISLLKNLVNSEINSNLEELSDNSDVESSHSEDDDDEDLLTLDQISKLNSEYKDLLLRLVEHVLNLYPNSPSQEDSILIEERNVQSQIIKDLSMKKINDKNGVEGLRRSKRRYYSACVRKGQVYLLNKFKILLKR